MARRLNPSYAIDLLEESIAFQRPVTVVVKSGYRFVDQVREIVTELDEDWVVFAANGRIRVSDIAGCSPTQQLGANASDVAA
jgi:hypothetical protein